MSDTFAKLEPQTTTPTTIGDVVVTASGLRGHAGATVVGLTLEIVVLDGAGSLFRKVSTDATPYLTTGQRNQLENILSGLRSKAEAELL